MTKIFHRIQQRFQKLKKTSLIEKELRGFHDLSLQYAIDTYIEKHPNPVIKHAQKCYSQSDEDGITLEILRRLDLKNVKTFLELGVGTGIENNTLILAALGWTGKWVDSLDLEIDTGSKVEFEKSWITTENAATLIPTGADKANLEVISVDLDRNDFHIVKVILETNVRPSLFIVEINAKFPPPIEFITPYSPRESWDNSDYGGASLQAFVNLFAHYEYMLVACNPGTGSNAFFVPREYAKNFDDVPTDIRDLYVPPRHNLLRHYGHPYSLDTIAEILR